ncbi:hypothetical protein MN608_00883 [Microdochium nivale]|nr:hypothetical protein MN608_00883 [Microdochium nivale]
MLLDYAPRRGITLDWHKHAASVSGNVGALAGRAALTMTQMAGHARQNSVAVLDDTLCGCTSTSMTTALIILLASVVGTALITSTATWLLLRCRYSRTMSKSDKGGRQSPSQPSSPRWQTWARSAPRPRPTAQPGDDLQIGVATDNPGRRMPEASAGQATADGAGSDFLGVRRRPEYASGLSSTFMFPRKDPGITTIISDATRSNSRKLKSKRIERSRSRRKSPDPEPEQPEETPRMSEGGGIGSTERLVPAGDRKPGEVPALVERGGLDDDAGAQPPARAPSKSTVDAMRDRLHSSSRASNRTGSPALSSRAPTIPKRSSLRVEILPTASSSGAAPSPSFYHVGSGFPENSLHAGLQTPFASLVQLPPAEEEQQQKPEAAALPPAAQDDDDDDDPPRPSTSDTIGSPERSRRPHRARKGTLTMFPKIQDGPPVSLAGLVMPSRASSEGRRQRQQQQDDDEEEVDHAGDQRGYTAIPLRKRSYSESSALAVPEDSVPPRRSFGPNWPFAPV